MNAISGLVRLPVGDCAELSMRFNLGENWNLDDMDYTMYDLFAKVAVEQVDKMVRSTYSNQKLNFNSLATVHFYWNKEYIVIVDWSSIPYLED